LAALLGNNALAGEHLDRTHNNVRHDRPAQHSINAREHRQNERLLAEYR